MNRKIGFILVLLLLFCLSYLRDTLIIVINAQLIRESQNYANTMVPGFLTNYTQSGLLRIKWIAEIAFSLLIIGFSILGIHLYFRNKTYSMVLTLFYMITCIYIVLFEFFFRSKSMSFQAQSLLTLPEALIHSPLVLLVLFAGLLIVEKQTSISPDK